MIKTPKIKMTKDQDVHTLSITAVAKKHIGIYKVTATNDLGAIEHEAPVIVTGERLTLQFQQCLLEALTLPSFLEIHNGDIHSWCIYFSCAFLK